MSNPLSIAPANESALEQRLANLARAERIRRARAAEHRRVRKLPMRDGLWAIGGLVKQMPLCIETLSVGDLLHWPHRWGDRKARRLLGSLGIKRDLEAVRLRDLDKDERLVLVAAIFYEAKTDRSK